MSEMDICNIGEISRRVAQFRIAIGKSQLELAEEAGMPVMALIAVEQGRLEPSIAFLHYLGHQYRMDFNWLISGSGKMFISGESANDDNSRWEDKEMKHRELLTLMEVPAVKAAIDAALLEIVALMRLDGSSEDPESGEPEAPVWKNEDDGEAHS